MSFPNFIAAVAATLCLATAATGATVKVLPSGLTATLDGRNVDAWAKVKPTRGTALQTGASWAPGSSIFVLPSDTYAINAKNPISSERLDPCRNACSPFYGGVFGNPGASAVSADGWETIPFFVVFDPHTTIAPFTNSAQLTFAGRQSALTLLWGSPDGTNLVELLLGGKSVAEFRGANFDSLGTGIVQEPGRGAALLTLSGFNFNAVRFTSFNKKGTFEFSNVSTIAAVPVPASMLLILSGLGAIVVVGRRRRA